ncbi:MAG: acylphosphatase [Candidatus Levyibacteriota bacterium]
MKQVKVTISGTVQGVSFRYFVAEQAQLLGVKGWVRNTPEGNVEALFQGEEGSVAKMVKRCLKGPAMAAVENVSLEDTREPIYQDFVIRS